MVSTNATFEVIQTIDRQVIARGIYFGKNPAMFVALRQRFEEICQHFENHRVFVPVSPSRVTEEAGQWTFLKIFDTVEDSIRVDELIDWIRDLAQHQFMTPHQYTDHCRKSAI